MFLILIPILLTFLLAAINLIFARFRPDSRYLWLIDLIGVFLIWGITISAVAVIPAEYQFYQWLQLSTNVQAPNLILDQISWPFALSLAGVLFLVEITFPARQTRPDFLVKTGDFTLVGVGLIAVLSGNLIALILGWAAIDLIEFLLLTRHMAAMPSSLPLVRGLSFRMAGLLALLLCLIIGFDPAATAGYVAGSQVQVILILLAAGLRLGVIPLNLPTLQEDIIPIGSGTIIRIVPAVASLILLSRMGEVILPSGVFAVFLGLTLFASVYTSFAWLFEENVIYARHYWIVGMSSLAFAAVLLNVPLAATAWTLALIFGGATLFLSNIRSRWFKIVLALGVILIAGVPYSPSWPGSLLFNPQNSWIGLFFMLPLVLLLAGYLKFVFQDQQIQETLDRWRMVMYYFGFMVLFISEIWLGVWSALIVHAGGLIWAGSLMIVLLIAGLYLGRRNILREFEFGRGGRIFREIFSLSWVYQILWFVYHQAGRIITLISGLIEGESGTLWSILLLVVLLSLLGSLLR